MKSLKEVKILALAVLTVVLLSAALPSTVAQEETIPTEVDKIIGRITAIARVTIAPVRLNRRRILLILVRARPSMEA